MNLSTIIVALVVVAIFSSVVITGIRNKKSGKGGCSCGCSCEGCSGVCHSGK